MFEKVIYLEDFVVVEVCIVYEICIVMGFDVYCLVEGEELWFGGVLILYDKGLLGYSDVDVVFYVLIDVLFGIIVVGDIGMYFLFSDL